MWSLGDHVRLINIHSIEGRVPPANSHGVMYVSLAVNLDNMRILSCSKLFSSIKILRQCVFTEDSSARCTTCQRPHVSLSESAETSAEALQCTDDRRSVSTVCHGHDIQVANNESYQAVYEFSPFSSSHNIVHHKINVCIDDIMCADARVWRGLHIGMLIQGVLWICRLLPVDIQPRPSHLAGSAELPAAPASPQTHQPSD